MALREAEELIPTMAGSPSDSTISLCRENDIGQYTQVHATYPPLQVIRPGRAIHTESGRIIYAVITINRLYERAAETANSLENILELDQGDVGIFPGIDFISAGFPLAEWDCGKASGRSSCAIYVRITPPLS